MSATICWSTHSDPTSLFNVGTDALGMCNDNIIAFINLKTNVRTYCRIDNYIPNASIAVINGHNRFPLYAFAEACLRPAVHVLRYPDNSKFQTFPLINCLRVVDVRFSETDHLIALSGGPDYKILIWNIRSGYQIVEQETYVECDAHSLFNSNNFNPMIGQFSNFTKTLLVWQMCYSTDRYVLHNISKVKMHAEHTKSSLFTMCYGDDGILYVVDDLGDIHSVDLACFSLKREWTSPRVEAHERRAFYLNNNKSGLLISCSDMVYFIKKKTTVWSLEWSITENCDIIEKIITNYNGEIYGSDIYGNVYHIEMNSDNTDGEWSSLSYICNNNFFVLDYSLMRGLKEELIMVLNSDGELCLFEIFRMTLMSVMFANGAVCLAVHNSLPYVAVGTTDGQVIFYCYEKSREPFELGVLRLESGVELIDLRIWDVTMFVRDDQQRFHILSTDFKLAQFSSIGTMLMEETDNVMIVNYFLVDNNRALVFVNTNANVRFSEKYANELWLYHWSDRLDDGVPRTEFKLPDNYRSFSVSTIMTFKDTIEFFAIPAQSFNFDIFNVVHNNELVHTTTVRTNHIGHLSGIVVGRNVCTWSSGRTCYHFKTHKKSPKNYMISRFLYMAQMGRVVKRVEDCFSAKYLVVFLMPGILRVLRLPALSDSLRENIITMESPVSYTSYQKTMKLLEGSKFLMVKPPTVEEFRMRDRLVTKLTDISKEVSDLIDYDISVTQKTHGIFRKFCLNAQWMHSVTAEAQILCNRERDTLQRCIFDHARIRDWIRSVITCDTAYLSIKIMSLFANTFFESYSIVKPIQELAEVFDLYRFYDLDPMDDGDDGDEDLDGEDLVIASVGGGRGDADDPENNEAGRTGGLSMLRQRHPFIIKGSAYEHIMAEEFLMQDKNNVTVNQIYNTLCKFRYVWINALKAEFNKMFIEAQNFKQEIMDNINNTNSSLGKIHENMNIMLRLLHMVKYRPPYLSVPEWNKEEILERIMEVNDSEIKAINRRKKKAEVSEHKHGRMLLWAIEFWIRALMVMMDGVLEKLWEEEIKKDIPVPEFVLKKNVHEYSLEEQKQFRQYEENVRLLTDDRRKYLRILKDRENKTLLLKSKYIMQLNERCTQLALQKMKYDFAVKTIRLRSLNLKIKHNKRLECLEKMKNRRKDLVLTIEYIGKYNKLAEFYERSITEIKGKLETLTARDKQIDRQFKGQYLSSLPATVVHESMRLYKRRPKIPQKSFNSPLICLQVANRLLQKSSNRVEFPLPQEVKEYVSSLEALDETTNTPNQMDVKSWDLLVKLRRQKLETELKLRATNQQLNDTQSSYNNYVKQVQYLKNTRARLDAELEETKTEYDDIVNNQYLQITLTMGQIEVRFGGDAANLEDCILMHIDDINDVNALIKVAGELKLKSMQKVARFRRKVIYKEWEHKTVRANIDYLRYMLDVIEKCRVSMEFLNIIRKWRKVKEQRGNLMAVGVIENLIEQRIGQARRIIDVLNRKIDAIRDKIQEMRRKNQMVNKQIEDVKVHISLSSVHRDVLIEEKYSREQKERMSKIRTHRNLVDTVRMDYAKILELTTLLELQRLRTYPTLGPPPVECN